MIKSREPSLERISVTIQIGFTLFCFYFTLWFSGFRAADFTNGSKEHFFFAIMLTPIWFGLLELFELGALSRIQRYRDIFKKYAAVVIIGAFALILLIEVFELNTINTSIILKFALLNFFVLSFQKIAGRSIMKSFRKKGYNTRMILIIADESTIPFINQINENEEWGYIIRGILTTSKKVISKFENKFPVFIEYDDFVDIIDKMIIDEVFFCQQRFKPKRINKLINQCRDIGVIFHMHNSVLSFSGLKPRLSHLNQNFFLSFIDSPGNYYALKIKGTLDFFLTIIIIIMLSPVMLTIAILIKLEDGGPILFKQVRVGKHGRLFKCKKFRTMVINAEELKANLMALNEQEGPVFKIKDDPRVTKIGKFLRKTSLDELPQFFNVLVGDMSIVGPRPPIPSEVKQYKRQLTRRLSITPGITCIWQVSGRNNIPFDKWMEMDMEYIDNWSLMLDFSIILKTFKVMIDRNGQ